MLLEIGLLFLLIFIIFYRFITKDFNYFAGQNISVSKPSFPFGSSNVKNMFMGKIAFLDCQGELVKEFPNDKVMGYFMFQSPRFLINDWDLAKQILIKDFEYFTDRPAFPDADPITSNFMTNLSGTEWKKMRVLMSGVFTSGRLRLMLPHISEAGQNFAKYIDKISQEGIEIDMKDTGGMLTLDSIATAGFGIQVDSFADPDNTFRRQALALTGAQGYTEQNPMWGFMKILIIQAWPWLGIDILKLKILPPKAVAFFSDAIKKTYQQRLATKQKRNDLIDVVIEEMRKSGKEKTNSEANNDENIDEFEANAALDTSDMNATKFEDEEIVLISNAFLFFFAGFDTSASGFGFVCHKLCMHEDKQELVYEEIMDVIGKEGAVTFDKLSQLKYMDRFISESLRFTKLFPQLERVCTKNYKIPGTDIVISKGRVVNIFTLNFGYDEKNFYNPNQFDPENFNPENNPNKFGFSSFGQGPRNCIGMRYALLVLKVGLVNLLRNHKIKRGSTMQEELKIAKDLKHVEGRLPATIHRRED